MTVNEIIAASAPYLERRGVSDARLAVEHLVARLLKCKRLELPLRQDEALAENQINAMRRGVAKLATGEPVQYVLGRWDFRGITLKIDRRALIPRPETEQLVQLLFDSGALSIADEAPNAKIAAIDTSADALALARENADALGLADKITFLNTSEFDLGDVFDAQSFEVVISNPPYISSAACDRLSPSVRDFEPRAALDGGPDGMALLRSVIEDASTLLVSGGMIFLELGAEEKQIAPISHFLESAGFEEIRASRDLRNAERFLSARLALGL